MNNAIAVAICLCCVPALADQVIDLTNEVGSVTFTDQRGLVYRKVRLSRAYKDGVAFRWDSGADGFAYYTNLSPTVLESLGIPTVPDPTSNDWFLAQYRGPDVTAERRVTSAVAGIKQSWGLTVHAKGFELTSYRWLELAHERVSGNYARIKFRHSEEVLAQSVFLKLLEWEAIAATNHTESFSKMIPAGPLGDSGFVFEWNAQHTAEERATLNGERVSGDVMPRVNRQDVLHFMALLREISTLKDELAQKIRKADREKDLFR